MHWTQHNELAFIGALGSERQPHIFGEEGYTERCVRGYIDSLEHRTVWWQGVSVDALRTAAYRRLAEVTET